MAKDEKKSFVVYLDWFDALEEVAPEEALLGASLRLDRRTRMMYDADNVFINGESFRAGGRDARLMHELADMRRLTAKAAARLSDEAREIVHDWMAVGWVHADAA